MPKLRSNRTSSSRKKPPTTSNKSTETLPKTFHDPRAPRNLKDRRVKTLEDRIGYEHGAVIDRRQQNSTDERVLEGAQALKILEDSLGVRIEQ